MPYATIVAPIDIHDPASGQLAVDKVRFLANAGGGSVHLLHVTISLPTRLSHYMRAEFEREARREAMAELASYRDRLALPEDRVTLSVRQGRVASEVLTEAEARGADLLVIGAHQPNVIGRLLGTNATIIVRDAQIDVLVAREPK